MQLGCGLKVAVIGDSIIDEYIECEVSRISPEAPVPVARFNNKREVPGGALNVAANFALLGAEVSIFSAVGEDFDLRLPSEINTNCLVRVKGKQTVRKSRICCGNKQLLRLDVDSYFDGNAIWAYDLVDSLGYGNFDVIALADYGLGFLSSNLPLLAALQSVKDRFIALDPHPRNFNFISELAKFGIELSLLKPNAQEFLGISKLNPGKFDLDACRLPKSVGSMLLTKGSQGMTFIKKGQSYNVAANDVPVFDVSGAGDAVFASFICAIRSGYSAEAAMKAASFAAQTVITKFGTVPLDREQFENFMRN